MCGLAGVKYSETIEAKCPWFHVLLALNYRGLAIRKVLTALGEVIPFREGHVGHWKKDNKCQYNDGSFVRDSAKITYHHQQRLPWQTFRLLHNTTSLLIC